MEAPIPDDKAILLSFYKTSQPDFANDLKIGRIIATYKRKAATQGPGVDWRELMYATFLEQKGVDPRAVYEAGSQTRRTPRPSAQADSTPTIVRVAPADPPPDGIARTDSRGVAGFECARFLTR